MSQRSTPELAAPSRLTAEAYDPFADYDDDREENTTTTAQNKPQTQTLSLPPPPAPTQPQVQASPTVYAPPNGSTFGIAAPPSFRRHPVQQQQQNTQSSYAFNAAPPTQPHYQAPPREDPKKIEPEEDNEPLDDDFSSLHVPRMSRAEVSIKI